MMFHLIDGVQIRQTSAYERQQCSLSKWQIPELLFPFLWSSLLMPFFDNISCWFIAKVFVPVSYNYGYIYSCLRQSDLTWRHKTVPRDLSYHCLQLTLQDHHYWFRVLGFARGFWIASESILENWRKPRRLSIWSVFQLTYSFWLAEWKSRPTVLHQPTPWRVF